MKKVSVILTTFNSEKSIKRTIESILKQKGLGSEFDLELIVVDDCSTDNTREILTNFKIDYLSTEKNSGGPNKGRNIGLRNAAGDFICIADHDDEWSKDRIKTLLPYLDKVSIVSSGYTLIDQKSGRTTDRLGESQHESKYYSKNFSFLTKLTRSWRGQKAYLGSLIFHGDLKCILFEENFGVVDFDWILSMLYQNDSIEVSRSLYKRYFDGANLSLNNSYRIMDFYFSLMTIEKYRESFPKEFQIAYRKIHGSRARYYYLMNDMKLARFYFRKSGFNLKNFAYYVTTYAGSDFVKKKFNVFG